MPPRKKPEEIDPEEKDYRFMTALARGLSVLRAFGPGNEPLGNAEIAERVGLSKPTVSRITFTLTELGYLNYIEASGRYRLGIGVLNLGYDVMAQLEIRDIARPFMQELADYADASIYLGMPDGHELVYIEACRSPASMTIRLGVGSRIPIPSTSMGRAYLAALPEDDRTALMERIGKKYGKDWPAIKKATTRAVKLAHERGFATSIGEWISEANSAACVIRRADGHPAFAVNIGGLASIITAERLERDLGPRIVGVARQIEHSAQAIL